nr:trihelix transcription factor ASIL2-like [Ipomoea batatas]
MGEMTDSLTATAPSSRPLPFREDCWSEEATATLVDAWGRRFMELNRGNLRHKDWQDVADAVNELHGHTKKGRRTDVQCKNRIDTLKKKYKAEKAKIVESDGTLTASTWPFFSRLDVLIGNSDANEEDGREESEEEMEASEGTKEEDGIRRLAKAIERFGAIYERVEGMKRRQMIELEKQRMEFAKDLELQRMQLIMDTQVQLVKNKQAKRPSSDGIIKIPTFFFFFFFVYFLAISLEFFTINYQTIKSSTFSFCFSAAFFSHLFITTFSKSKLPCVVYLL